jgi:putative colanic acid biosynthesis acetyltransferase WcaF
MDLKNFENSDFTRGASRLREMAWLLISALTVAGPIPGSRWRASLLRAFGAKIAKGVVLKPRVQVKFPWRLEIDDNAWIGEGAWIDNLALVRIGRDCCISQGAYLGTGNHDWTSPSFDLVTSPIILEDQCWVGARATVVPGTYIEQGAVLGMGAVGAGRLKGWTIYSAGRAFEFGARRETGVDTKS